jgi:hypothetical protein
MIKHQPPRNRPRLTPPRHRPLPSETSTPAPTPVKIVGVYEAIEFYPACGTETLDHQDVTWYLLVHSGFDPTDPPVCALLARIA